MSAEKPKHTDIDKVEADAWNLAGLARVLMLLADKIQCDNQQVDLNEDTAALEALAVLIRDRANRLASDINGLPPIPKPAPAEGGAAV